jgi:hypothetical protein
MQRIAGGVQMAAAGVAAALLVGCTNGAATWAQLRKRASFDLDCPLSSVKIYEIDNRTAGVNGCGQRATYVETCESHQYGSGMTSRDHCTWVLNGDAKSAKKAADEEE